MINMLTRYFVVTIGCIVVSCAINLFFVPHHLLAQGLSGLGILFYYMFGWPIGLQLLIYNLPLLYLAYRLIGKEYVVTTIYGTILFSIVLDATRFLSDIVAINDPILSAIAGGAVAGLGGGLVFRVSGSLGGLDIIATIVKKYYSLNIGLVLFSVNCIMALSAAFFFGLKLAVLSLVAMYIGASVTDKVVEGFNNKKSVYIISYHPDHIIKSILNAVGRGVTILHGEGAYTRQDKQILFVVVSLSEIAQIKGLVHIADPDAFMIVSDAAEVLGKGFSRPKAHPDIELGK